LTELVLMNHLKFLDVSGVGNSGKSALVDLLREIDGLYVPHFQFEFDFLRVRGGLIDLRHALVEDWSPVRSHAAFKAFIDVTNRMGANPRSWLDMSAWLASTSQRYDRYFNGRFTELTHKFAEKFIIGKFRSEWPYDDLNTSSIEVFLRKILRRIGFRKNLLREVLLLDGSNFDEFANQLLIELFETITPPNCQTIVLNNGFEPFNPVPFLEMINGSKQIVVTRDPRDVYVSGLNSHAVAKTDKALLAPDNDGLNKSFLAADDVELFIRRFKLFNRNVFFEERSKILHVSFESLVTSYEATTAQLFDFLEVSPNSHIKKCEYFDPNKSKRNVRLWEKFSDQKPIRRIESELGAYIVNS
jgi:hypothetical protein